MLRHKLCSSAPLFWRGCKMRDLIIGALAGFMLCLYFSGSAMDAIQARKIQAGVFEHNGKAYRITPMDKD